MGNNSFVMNKPSESDGMYSKLIEELLQKFWEVNHQEDFMSAMDSAKGGLSQFKKALAEFLVGVFSMPSSSKTGMFNDQKIKEVANEIDIESPGILRLISSSKDPEYGLMALEVIKAYTRKDLEKRMYQLDTKMVQLDDRVKEMRLEIEAKLQVKDEYGKWRDMI